MHLRALLPWIWIAGLLLSTACGGPGSAQPPADGISRIYPVTAEGAYDIALHALRWQGAESIEEHRGDLHLVAELPDENGSRRVRAGVWVHSEGLAASKVTIEAKSARSSGSTVSPMERLFHEDFGKGVEFLSNGMSLPATRPE